MTNESTESQSNKNEKRNWFHSLSRRKKSSTSTTTSTSQRLQSQDENAAVASVSTPTPEASAATSTLTSSQESSVEDSINNSTSSGKDRSKRNVFQRFKKRMGIHFSIRQKKPQPDIMSSRTNDHDIVEGIVCYPNDLHDPPEMIPFTHHYRKFVTKKWLDNGSPANRVMYTACSEMLGQVWYWGEISRRDAQRQLKDKPIGTFLVRDSETEGPATYWYTLSFRILNCTLHYRLEYRANYWHFEELQYESIVEMIEDILHRCTKDHFVCYVRVSNELQPPHAVVLKYPLSRYISIMKLQDLCRSVIQRHVSPDEIQELQIPVKLQEYLCEKRELVFQSS